MFKKYISKSTFLHVDIYWFNHKGQHMTFSKIDTIEQNDHIYMEINLILPNCKVSNADATLFKAK